MRRPAPVPGPPRHGFLREVAAGAVALQREARLAPGELEKAKPKKRERKLSKLEKRMTKLGIDFSTTDELLAEMG